MRTKYEQEVLPALREKFGRTNPHALPRLTKIVVNMGVGAATSEKKFLDEAVSCMTQITGQKPAVCKARKSVSAFRLREGQEIGCKVTLRGARMYEFLDRLVSLALPRVRDFRGVNPDAFDGHGNYSLGLTESLVFPELSPDKVTRTQGMNITVCISGGSNEESRELLRMMGMPFKTDEGEGGRKAKA
jgi:large subunit ribosomal protein L5